MTLDFHTNNKILEKVAIILSKRLRNKIAGFSTHLMKRIQKGPVQGISLKLQEKERERCMDFVPDESAIKIDNIEVDNKERMNWLSSVQLWNSDQHCSNIHFNNSKEISKTETIKLHHMYELPLAEVLELIVSVLGCADAEQVSSYFEKYGEITYLYMPQDPTTKGHRGIGFITFANSDFVDDLMAETHELGGSTIVVDHATPKDPK